MSPRRQQDEEVIGGAEVPDELKWAGSRLDAWMSRMEDKIDKLTVDMAAVASLRNQVEDHRQRIYGNGSPGLIKDVDRMKQRWKAIYWVIGLFSTATAAEFFSRFLGGSK